MKETKYIYDEIANKIQKLTGFQTKVYPPMGLRASISISANDGNKTTGFITLTSNKDHDIMYDTGKILKEYPVWSIGYMNGFGKETKPLPDDIEAIWEIMRCKD